MGGQWKESGFPTEGGLSDNIEKPLNKRQKRLAWQVTLLGIKEARKVTDYSESEFRRLLVSPRFERYCMDKMKEAYQEQGLTLEWCAELKKKLAVNSKTTSQVRYQIVRDIESDLKREERPNDALLPFSKRPMLLPRSIDAEIEDVEPECGKEETG